MHGITKTKVLLIESKESLFEYHEQEGSATSSKLLMKFRFMINNDSPGPALVVVASLSNFGIVVAAAVTAKAGYSVPEAVTAVLDTVVISFTCRSKKDKII